VGDCLVLVVDIFGLTDSNCRRLVCGAVHGWTPGGFVLPVEWELGEGGSGEETKG
jgi:hypothetical protein